MRISSGPRKVVSDRAIAPIPQNRGMAATAQAAIDIAATVAARRSAEAIKVDGYPVYVHKYGSGSVRCSCQGAKSAQINEPRTGVLSDSGRIDDVLNPSMTVHLRGRANANSQIDEAEFFDLPEMDKRPETFNDTSFDQNDPGNGEPIDDILDNLFPTLDGKRCGICGGTGYEDSYKWISGIKYNLTVRNVHDYRNNLLNAETRPYSFELGGGSYILWRLDVPAYFIGIDRWKTMDNMDLDNSLLVEVDLGLGAGFAPINNNSFDLLKGQGGSVTIRVTPKNSNPEQVTAFTHIVIWLQTVELPYAQFPQLDRDINPSTVESLINTQFEIEPHVGALTRKTTLESPAQGRMWYVSSITNKQTSKNYVFNIQGSVTVIQPTSSLYGLAAFPSFTQKIPHNYRGIERGPDKTGLPYDKRRDRFIDSNALANNYSDDNIGGGEADDLNDFQTVNINNTKL